eukprot:symbB.v1.2.044098.t1/scaffold25153.1/size426/1
MASTYLEAMLLVTTSTTSISTVT